MKRTIQLGLLMLSAAALSGCNYGHYVAARDIKVGQVIQESDLAIDRRHHHVIPESWVSSKDRNRRATPKDRSKVVGHKAKVAIESGWAIILSNID